MTYNFDVEAMETNDEKSERWLKQLHKHQAKVDAFEDRMEDSKAKSQAFIGTCFQFTRTSTKLIVQIGYNRNPSKGQQIILRQSPFTKSWDVTFHSPSGGFNMKQLQHDIQEKFAAIPYFEKLQKFADYLNQKRFQS